MLYNNPQDNTVTLQRLGNLAYLVMGMRTEGGKTPYAMTVVANPAPGSTQINGNAWQGDPVGKSGYSLGVMQYDFGAFGNKANTTGFAQQVVDWAQSQGTSLDADGVSGLATALALRGGTEGQGLEVTSNWISTNDRDTINGYLATDAGQRWAYNNLEVGNFTYKTVDGQTVIAGGTGAVTQAVAAVLAGIETKYYKNLSAADQQIVEVMLLKEANQGGPGSAANAAKWLDRQGNITGSAAAFLDARQSALVGNPSLSQGIGEAYNASAAVSAIQQSPLFSPIWAKVQSGALDAPTIAQDPDLVALRAVFTGGASVATINAIGNRTPGTFSGDGKNGFIAVDSSGRVVVLQSAVSNGTPGSNGGAPATAQGWQLDGNGTWQGFTEGIGRGSRYIIQKVPGAKNKWVVIAQNEDGSEVPTVTLAEGNTAQVNINGTTVALDVAKSGIYAFMDDGVLVRAGLSPDLTLESGEVLTGVYVGNTYTRQWREGNPNLQLGFSANEQGSSASLNTLAVLTDSSGKTIEIDTTPLKASVNGQEQVVGFNEVTTVKQNSILQSTNASSLTLDPQTGERTTATDNTLYSATGTFVSHSATSTVTDSAGLQLNQLAITYNAQGGITQTSFTERQPDSSQLITKRDGQSNTLSTTRLQTNDDATTLSTTTYPNGKVETLATDASGSPASLNVTTPTQNDSQQVSQYTFVNGKPVLLSSTAIDYFYDDNGVSRIETISSPSGSLRNAYDTDGILSSSTPVVRPGPSQLDQQITQTLQTTQQIVDFGKLLASGAPDPVKTLNGVVLINSLFNAPNAAGQVAFPNFGTSATYAQGALSVYNLSQAFASNNGAAQINATLGTVNFVNNTLLANTTNFGNAALRQTLGDVLPGVGLITAIANGDAIGAATNIGLLFNPAFLTTPLGWFLVGASILKSVLGDKGPPDAWGTANISFADGPGDLTPKVNATGESFGVGRVQAQLQSVIDALNSTVKDYNDQQTDSTQRLGLIPQRLPSLTWRASEFADSGYSVLDVNAITGEQRYPNLRFDDQGRAFGLTPAEMTPALRALLTVPGAPDYPQLNAYLFNIAQERGALAPLWQVQTAKLQGLAGDPNAGVSDEERAAKAGLGANVDTAYAAAHPNDVNANSKRLGGFMPIGIDLDGDGTVSTVSMATSHVSFDWDGTGYKKNVGWVAGNDGFLVLDSNFNASVDNGAELVSNPLVADELKGLRSLAALDANGDGRIDASDPAYQQLKVWQDFNQDGRNVHGLLGYAAANDARWAMAA